MSVSPNADLDVGDRVVVNGAEYQIAKIDFAEGELGCHLAPVFKPLSFDPSSDRAV